MEFIVQNLIFGLFVGSIYGIGAVGLALVFGVMKLMNIAHGELVMVGAVRGVLVVCGCGDRPLAVLVGCCADDVWLWGFVGIDSV